MLLFLRLSGVCLVKLVFIRPLAGLRHVLAAVLDIIKLRNLGLRVVIVLLGITLLRLLQCRAILVHLGGIQAQVVLLTVPNVLLVFINLLSVSLSALNVLWASTPPAVHNHFVKVVLLGSTLPVRTLQCVAPVVLVITVRLLRHPRVRAVLLGSMHRALGFPIVTLVPLVRIVILLVFLVVTRVQPGIFRHLVVKASAVLVVLVSMVEHQGWQRVPHVLRESMGIIRDYLLV